MGLSRQTRSDLLTGQQSAAGTRQRARRNNDLSNSSAQRIARGIQLCLHSASGNATAYEFFTIGDREGRNDSAIRAAHTIHIGKKVELISLKAGRAGNSHLIR